MSDTSLETCYHDFEETHRSEETNTGTPACRTNVIIHHKDTLGRNLPAGIMVKVYDEVGGVYYGKIDKQGQSQHLGVKCGNICWQLMKGAKDTCETGQKYNHKDDNWQLTDEDEQVIFNSCDGYVLIKANDVKTKEPRKQLSDPLKVSVHWNGGPNDTVNALYLPPPILLNLRFRQNKKPALSEAQIQQIQQDGGTATLFIHGYNVPLGKLGTFPQAEDFGKRPILSNLPRGEEIQRPYLHYSNEIIAPLANNILMKELLSVDGDSNDLRIDQMYKGADSKFNGDKTLSWFPHVEYYLNLAASGSDELKEFTDWEKYSRIVGVTWSGSVDPGRVFFRAEIYANEAGRELAKVLKELIDVHNIRINIITHSLGARVALSALNILGDFDGKYDEKVDNLIMWEAAVADNAITNLENYKKMYNPIAMEFFPFAYKAVKHISILYSPEDGVLGPDNKGGDAEYTGLVGGAYPKKYTALANNTLALGDYYKRPPAQAKKDKYSIKQDQDLVNSARKRCDIIYGKDSNLPYECTNLSASVLGLNVKARIRAALEQEAEQISQGDGISELEYLKPWSHFRRFEKGSVYFEHIIEVLTETVFENWNTRDSAVRQALGHQGNRQTVRGIGQNGTQFTEPSVIKLFVDPFIQELEKIKKKITFVDQLFIDENGNKKSYFISHSAMREWEWSALDKFIPKLFPLIYSKSYKEAIMNRIKDKSNFGRY